MVMRNSVRDLLNQNSKISVHNAKNTLEIYCSPWMSFEIITGTYGDYQIVCKVDSIKPIKSKFDRRCESILKISYDQEWISDDDLIEYVKKHPEWTLKSGDYDGELFEPQSLYMVLGKDISFSDVTPVWDFRIKHIIGCSMIYESKKSFIGRLYDKFILGR